MIALLGAESTGKTELARALTGRLRQNGVAATRVDEYLREWCAREGRTPRVDEQAAIAAEQTRRIAAAAATAAVVVADTTALMTAVYSDLLFQDRSLYADALAAQRGYTLTLLTALDLPWVADGLQRDGPQVREPVDGRVRAALAGANVPYAVVCGSGPERLESLWNAIDFVANFSGGNRTNDRFCPAAGWCWPCEKCSDPVCEHRLFTDLLAYREPQGDPAQDAQAAKTGIRPQSHGAAELSDP
ncbi:MAG: ATPase [Variovorax sp.]|nr:ATPase [Variovorax sp.]